MLARMAVVWACAACTEISERLRSVMSVRNERYCNEVTLMVENRLGKNLNRYSRAVLTEVTLSRIELALGSEAPLRGSPSRGHAIPAV